ncbi:MAG: hypothetical protein NT164_03405 [Verrucomicrobiae bacterium]|nr:hypothetical protein [Verrucomicrobiae bacterium]
MTIFWQRLKNRLSLIEYCDGSKRIFKTSRSHCKSNELKFRREIVAYRLSRLLKLDLVPETEGGEHRYFRCTELTKGIVQSFIPESSLFEEELVEISEDEKRKFFEKHFPSLPSLCSLSQEEKEEAFLIMVAQKALGFPGMLPSAWPLMVQLPLVKENPKHLFSRVLEEGKRIDEKRAYQLVQQRQIVLGRGDVTAITIIDFSQPLFQETMAQAHLFDLLLGEMDRHVHNFIYEQKGENVFLPRLIDHERSFSISFNNLSCLPYAISPLPQLIDHRLEYFQKSYSRTLRRHSGARVLEYLYTLRVCAPRSWHCIGYNFF